MKKTRKLNHDLVIMPAVMSGISTLIFVVIISVILLNFLFDEQMAKNKALAESIAFQIESYFSEPIEILRELNEVILEDELIEPEEYQVFIDTVLKNKTHLSSILILDRQGKVIHTSPYDGRTFGADHSQYPYFQDHESGQVNWSKAFHAYYSKYPLKSVSVDFGDKIIVGILNLQELSDLVHSIDLGEGNIIAIRDEQDHYIAHTDETLVFQREDYDAEAWVDSIGKNHYKIVDYRDSKMMPVTVLLQGHMWRVTVLQSLDNLIKPITNVLIMSFLLLAGILGLSVYPSIKRNNHITQMIQEIVSGTELLSSGNYKHQIKSGEYIELNDLVKHFNIMIEKLYALNNELEDKVEERTRQLKEANEELIKAEKISATNNLVAGIAHEINTPLGTGITSVTYLEDQTNRFVARLKNGDMTREALGAYLELIANSLQVLSKSLNKASNLVETFKLLSADKSSEIKSDFNVRLAINRALFLKRDVLEDRHINVEIELDDNYTLRGSPSEFSVIIHQLLENAIVHAYGEDRGRIEIKGWLDGAYMNIAVKDYGVGISPNNIPNIFDPFFTTARKQDCVGLGLNIAQNIVDGFFDGKIIYNEAWQEGTEFIVQVPLK